MAIQKKIEALLKTVIAGLLAILCLLVGYQVLARYVPFIPPFLWTEEISRGGLIWLVMLGTGLGFFQDSHFRMSAMLEKLTALNLKRALLLVYVLVAASGVLMALSGYEFVERGLSRVSFATGLPVAWVYLSMIVAGVLITAGATFNFLDLLRRRDSEDIVQKLR